MKFISATECRGWVDTNLPKYSTSNQEYYPCKIDYSLPVDSGVKTALARVIIQCVDFQSNGLFWITGWGVFPSAENMALFDGYRKSLGEERPLNEIPGHVFGTADLPQLECLISLALYFFWDASLFDESGKFIFKISHDEYMSILAVNDGQLKQLEDNFAHLKLKELK